MSSDRIEIRIEKPIRDIWEEYKDKNGFMSMKDLITTATNEYISQNSEITNEQKELIAEKQREREQKAIVYLMKRQSSELYFPHRFIQHLQKMLKGRAKGQIDNEEAVKHLQLACRYANACKNPLAILRNILPTLKQEKWEQGITIVKGELAKHNIPQEEIDRIASSSINRSSLYYHKRIGK